MYHIKNILKSNLDCLKQKGLFKVGSFEPILKTNAPPPLRRPGDYNLPRKAIEAIQDYSQGVAYDLNRFLEFGKVPDWSRFSPEDLVSLEKDLRQGLSALPNMEGRFYRQLGFGVEGSDLFGGSYDDFVKFTKQFKTGQNYSSNAFLSTTIREGAYSIDEAPYRAFLTIDGKTGKYIEDFSHKKGQYEAIFLPKTNFMVTDTSWNPDKTLFWASLREK